MKATGSWALAQQMAIGNDFSDKVPLELSLEEILAKRGDVC